MIDKISLVSTTIGAFLGASLSFFANIFIEYKRKPKLCFEIEEPPNDFTFNIKSAPAKNARFLRVKLINKSMPKWLKWLDRNTAKQCSGDIQFYHLEDYIPVFSKPMPIRWAEAEEPITTHILANGQSSQQFDYTKYNTAFRRDCFLGKSELIDIVVRFDDDNNCYGWTNDNYMPSKGWRNTDWEIPKGRYLIKLNVYSSGETASAVWQLENSTSQKHFRLIQATSENIKRLN
jgi:hypothetical protein